MRGNPISAGELRRIARLAGLEVEGHDLERLRREVSRVLELAEALVDDEPPGIGQPGRAGPEAAASVRPPRDAVPPGASGLPLREDECSEPVAADRLLAASPLVRERHVIVPRVIG